MQLSAGNAITKIHSSDAQEEDGGGRSESQVTRKCHAGFGSEGACFLPEAIRAWQRTLTSVNLVEQVMRPGIEEHSAGWAQVMANQSS